MSLYTVTSSPDGRTCTTPGTSCRVSGLTNQQTYSFTVRAASAAGTGSASTASNLVKPSEFTLVLSGYPTSDVAGVAHSITVTVKDSHGATATGYLGTVHFTSTDSKAVLPADYTFTVADAGVHKFTTTVTLKTAGTWSVTAMDSGNSNVAGTQTVSVTPAATKTFALSGFSSPDVAGVAHSITVTAKDAYGNTATGYTGTVTFTSTDTKAVLPANYTFTAANAGTHTFSVTLKTAGTDSVRARDTVTSTITGGQYPITVTPAAAATLVVSGLTTPRTAGTAGTITVKAVDAFGNTATGYLGTVHFTSTDTKAVLPANYTFTAANAGVHTFSVTLKTVGTQVIRARDTVTSTITGIQGGIVVS